MNKEQYEFSNVFWNDTEWNCDDGIPKYFEIVNEEMKFYYLDNNELKDFMKTKSLEDPTIMQDIRYKKLLRILKK